MTVPPRPQPTQTPIAALILRSVLAAILEAVRPVSRLKKLARPQRLFKNLQGILQVHNARGHCMHRRLHIDPRAASKSLPPTGPHIIRCTCRNLPPMDRNAVTKSCYQPNVMHLPRAKPDRVPNQG
jgi:hypothetical protein